MQAPARTPSASPATKGEIRALTGLRGIAALYVVFFHANGQYRMPDMIRPFIRHGYMAVDLFFILSGFVMAMTYAGLFEKGFCFKSFKQFLLLRLARIYPLFALMTVLTAILIATVLSKTYSFNNLGTALLFNFTLTHVWGFANSVVPPSWSISTEWAAYLLFPIGVFIGLRLPRRWSLLGLFVSFVVLGVIAYGPTWIAQSEIRHRHGPLDIASSYAIGTTLRCLASFYIGLVAYRFRDVIPARGAGVFFVLIIALLCVKGTDLLLIPAFALLIMSLSTDEGWLARLLQNRVFYWLGVISYALYLIHDLVLRIVFKAIPAAGFHYPMLTALVASILISLALATLSHYGYERPSRKVFRNLVGRWFGVPAAKALPENKPEPEPETAKAA
jgi:peptidoglycan/LPS O-acetylase OafA/YrhL